MAMLFCDFALSTTLPLAMGTVFLIINIIIFHLKLYFYNYRYVNGFRV